MLLCSPGNLLLVGISMCWRISLAFQNCCSSGKMTNSLCSDCWDMCQSSEGGPTNSEKTKTFRTLKITCFFWWILWPNFSNGRKLKLDISLRVPRFLYSWEKCLPRRPKSCRKLSKLSQVLVFPVLENNVCRGGQKIWPPADPWNDLGERGRVEMISHPLQLKIPPTSAISRQELSNILLNHDKDGYGQQVP